MPRGLASNRARLRITSKAPDPLASPSPYGHVSTFGMTEAAAPMSLASARGGGCILRAPGGPVDLDRYPLRGGSRVDQVEGCVRAGVGEQPRALADDHGADEQGDLVDKLVVEQPADQSAAAVHLQLTLPPGFQLADGARDVTREYGRVRPPRVGERGRCDVLGLRVQGRCDGVADMIYPYTCAPFRRAP